MPLEEMAHHTHVGWVLVMLRRDVGVMLIPVAAVLLADHTVHVEVGLVRHPQAVKETTPAPAAFNILCEPIAPSKPFDLVAALQPLCELHLVWVEP